MEDADFQHGCLSNNPADADCTGGLDWAGATLVVMNQDPTKAFGPGTPRS